MVRKKAVKTFSAGGVVLNPDNKVLVVSQRGGTWSLPKGHVDEGEDTLTAAKREIYEESGVNDLTLVSKFPTYARHSLNRFGEEERLEYKTIQLFLFKTDQEHLKPQDPHNQHAIWVNKEKVADLLTHEKDKEFFKSILEFLRKRE